MLNRALVNTLICACDLGKLLCVQNEITFTNLARNTASFFRKVRMRKTTSWSRRAPRGIGLVPLLFFFLQGCTHLAIEDCGGEVLGENEARIRSSHFRMVLADLPAASNRFSPYAAMSALAYAEDSDCGTTDPKLTREERFMLEADLGNRGWQEVKDLQWVPPCEDDVGLFFRVWKKLEADTRQIVIAFRGTWGVKDWRYGNLHWVTRLLSRDDQYSRARIAAQTMFDRFPEESHSTTRFYTTGHSLGGGLAQHVIYSYPNKVSQAFAFDPSSVTGFADQSAANQISDCQCRSHELNGEPRIFRIYDAYEVLSNQRIFHKIFFPPERHIQEVRFANAASHSMKGLAFYLLRNANTVSIHSVPWYSGKGNYSSSESCTSAFTRKQRASCEALVTLDQWNKCPQ